MIRELQVHLRTHGGHVAVDAGLRFCCHAMNDAGMAIAAYRVVLRR